MEYFVGIDGGGTRTTLGICDQDGREIFRRVGPAGLVDPRQPVAAAERLESLIRESVSQAGLTGPAAGLCAGLAGVGNPTERRVVEEALARAGIARSVVVVSDGETALHGALAGEPGILLIAGTGSVAWGRSESGQMRKAGGWGLYLGDEGSGYQIAREGLRAVLMAVDGRGPATRLLRILPDAIGLSAAEGIPPWIACAEKGEVAALAVRVLRAADEGDTVAETIARQAALELSAHIEVLARALGPWSSPPLVAFHGGVATDPSFRLRLTAAISALPLPVRIVPPRADAVAGALIIARSQIASIDKTA
ncbi:MAG: hypothetical protein LBG44_09395 [Gemmatimonadota bacterium]|nr:hypothetical protein [Gemmatimonadota bacterium]